MFIFTTILGFIPKLLDYKLRKQELQLGWFQLVLSVGKDICKFIGAHIKVFIVLAILTIGLTHYIGLKRAITASNAAKITAQKALLDHVQADSDAAKKREAENKLNARLAQKKTDANKSAYDAMIARLELNREKLEKDLHNEKSNIMRLYANARKLRDNQDSASSAGVSEIPLSTELLAERSDNNAIITLVDSSKETTANYNDLMQTWLDYCNIYGCQDIQQSVTGVQDEK
jgi:hypothetical protein